MVNHNCIQTVHAGRNKCLTIKYRIKINCRFICAARKSQNKLILPIYGISLHDHFASYVDSDGEKPDMIRFLTRKFGVKLEYRICF